MNLQTIRKQQGSVNFLGNFFFQLPQFEKTNEKETKKTFANIWI
jgi:hypothetical protein